MANEGLNKVMLIGNLGADPELKYTPNGGAVLKLRLATGESYMDKNKQRQERTEWHTVVVWGNRGEGLNKVLSKGSRLYIEGRLQTRSWDDKDGNKRYATDIVANNVLLLGGGNRAGGEGGGAGGGGGGGYGGGGGGGRSGGGGGYGGGGGGGGAGRGTGASDYPDQFPPDDFGGGGSDDDIPF